MKLPEVIIRDGIEYYLKESVKNGIWIIRYINGDSAYYSESGQSWNEAARKIASWIKLSE